MISKGKHMKELFDRRDESYRKALLNLLTLSQSSNVQELGIGQEMGILQTWPREWGQTKNSPCRQNY